MHARWAGHYYLTPAERVLEPHIASLGVPYRVQHPMFLWGRPQYFPDFLLPTLGIIVEVDGPEHNEKKAEDDLRTGVLNDLGYRVIRCTNNEALYEPGAVMERIAKLRELDGDRNIGIPPRPVKRTTRKQRK